MLSQQSKYALRAVIYLHQHHGEFVSVEEIARNTNLPAPYLSKILKALAAESLVISRRGKNGGVKINLKRKRVTFFDVCVSVDDPIVRSECVLFKKACDHSTPCAFHTTWTSSKAQLITFLRNTSL